MPGSTNYRGNPGLFNRHVELERDRAAARKHAEERLAQLEREASPIVVPAPRRRRATTSEPAPPVEATPEVAPTTTEQEI